MNGSFLIIERSGPKKADVVEACQSPLLTEG
jgi:hypothetical protein